MAEYKYPDNWIKVRIETPEYGVIDKIIAVWMGSYDQPDYWKINSGIEEIRQEKGEGGDIYVTGYSGSVYVLNPEREYSNQLIRNLFIQQEESLKQYNGTIKEVSIHDFN